MKLMVELEDYDEEDMFVSVKQQLIYDIRRDLNIKQLSNEIKNKIILDIKDDIVKDVWKLIDCDSIEKDVREKINVIAIDKIKKMTESGFKLEIK